MYSPHPALLRRFLRFKIISQLLTQKAIYSNHLPDTLGDKQRYKPSKASFLWWPRSFQDPLISEALLFDYYLMGSDLLHRFRCSWKPISDINKSPMLQGKFPECWKFHRGDYLNLPLTIAFQAHSDLLLSPGRAASAEAELLWKSLTQMGLVWEQTNSSGLSHKSMMPFPVMLAGATGCPGYRMMEPRLNSPCGYKGGLCLLCQHWRLRVCILVRYPLVLKGPPSGRGT